MMQTVALLLIVKNEEKYIRDCLESVKDLVDEIVVVDTGSTDKTLEIAQRYTDKLFQYSWNGDFSAARNFALTKASSEWILFLDADEELSDEERELNTLINLNTDKEAYLLPLYNPTSEIAGGYNIFYVLRLFRNNGCYHFQGSIHEQVTAPDEKKAAIVGKPVIVHKRISGAELNFKRGRNLKLLARAYRQDPSNCFLQYYFGVEWLMLGKPQKAYPYLKESCSKLTGRHMNFLGPALRCLILCLQALGRIDEAICLCMDTVLQYPDYTDIYYLGGVLFEEKREYLVAVKWLKQAVQSGQPPTLYSHMHGTEGFLAWHHLGYCLQMLGQREEAQAAYEKALETNPQYLYPLYSLFFLLQASYGTREIQEYFCKKGILGSIAMAKVVAQLFFKHGDANLAFQCVDRLVTLSDRDEELSIEIAKYAVLSGKIEHGVVLLDNVMKGKELNGDAVGYLIVASLLMGEDDKAKVLALSLWSRPSQRCMGYAFWCLIRTVNTGSIPPCPEKIREESILKVLLRIFDILTRYMPDEGCDNEPRYPMLRDALENRIQSISADGCLKLAEHYTHKLNGVKNLFTRRFGY